MGMINVNAKAGNTTDTVFNLELRPRADNPDYDRTKFRVKNNTSAVYMKVKYVKQAPILEIRTSCSL